VKNNYTMTYFKNIWIGSLLMLLSIGQLQAQNPKGKKAERLKALWVAYVTQELDLSSEESAKFWPIYNDYKEQERQLKRQKRQISRNNPQNMSEAEIDQQFESLMQLEEQAIQLKRNAYSNMKTAMPAYKIVRLPALEREFKKKVLKFMQERRENNTGGGNRERPGRRGGGRF
jgi:hypothetical protein